MARVSKGTNVEEVRGVWKCGIRFRLQSSACLGNRSQLALTDSADLSSLRQSLPLVSRFEVKLKILLHAKGGPRAGRPRRLADLELEAWIPRFTPDFWAQL